MKYQKNPKQQQEYEKKKYQENPKPKKNIKKRNIRKILKRIRKKQIHGQSPAKKKR